MNIYNSTDLYIEFDIDRIDLIDIVEIWSIDSNQRQSSNLTRLETASELKKNYCPSISLADGH